MLLLRSCVCVFRRRFATTIIGLQTSVSAHIWNAAEIEEGKDERASTPQLMVGSALWSHSFTRSFPTVA